MHHNFDHQIWSALAGAKSSLSRLLDLVQNHSTAPEIQALHVGVRQERAELLDFTLHPAVVVHPAVIVPTKARSAVIDIG